MKDSRKRLIAVCLVGTASGFGIWLTIRTGRTTAATKQVPAQTFPFTATRSDITLIPGQATPVRSQMRTIAVRSDGSNVELFHRNDPTGSGKTVYIKRVLDVQGKQSVVVDPISESIMTFPLVDMAVRVQSINGASQCRGNPAGQILNYDVAVDEEPYAGTPQLGAADEELRVRSWRSPRLDCYPLRREMTLSRAGSEVQRTIETVVAVTEGDPDGALFEIPKTYVERPPSQAMAESARRYRNSPEWRCPNCAQSQANKDKAYFHHWKHLGRNPPGQVSSAQQSK
jgi:hypothetical protein